MIYLHFTILLLISFVIISINSEQLSSSDEKSTKNKSLCTPKTANKLNNFMKEQWNLARQQLQLTSLDFNNNPSLFTKNVERFYKFSAGLCIFHLNNTIISYARIYKCANEAIIKNLNQFSRNDGALKWHTFLTLLSRNDVQLFKQKLNNKDVDSYKIFKYRPLDYDLVYNYNFPTFTFVRDPFLRFESGLAEAGMCVICIHLYTKLSLHYIYLLIHKQSLYTYTNPYIHNTYTQDGVRLSIH